MRQVKTKRPEWKMPKWMEQYRELFQNTGGNDIEDLLNDHDSHYGNNVVRAVLIACVDSQKDLLWRLARRGMLVGVDPKKIEEVMKGKV